MSPLPERSGELLVVPVDARLPKVCLKCGARKEITRRPHTYAVGSGGQAAGSAGAIGGVVLAQALRSVERWIAVSVFAAVVAGAAIAGWLMHRAAQKVELALPLCATCDAAWTEAESTRNKALIALGAAFATLAVGWGLASGPVLVAGGVLFVVPLVALWAAAPIKRLVRAMAVTKDTVSLAVDGPIADEIVRRAARRAERSATPAAEADEA